MYETTSIKLIKIPVWLVVRLLGADVGRAPRVNLAIKHFSNKQLRFTYYGHRSCLQTMAEKKKYGLLS